MFARRGDQDSQPVRDQGTAAIEDIFTLANNADRVTGYTHIFLWSNRVRKHHGAGISWIPAVHTRAAVHLKRIMDGCQLVMRDKIDSRVHKTYR